MLTYFFINFKSFMKKFRLINKRHNKFDAGLEIMLKKWYNNFVCFRKEDKNGKNY